MNPINSINSVDAASSAAQYPTSGKSTAPSANTTQSSPEDSVHLSYAGARELLQAGRIAIQSDRGNLNSTQVSALQSQEAQVYSAIAADQQANGGTMTAAEKYNVNQVQTQISHEIYSEAHDVSVSTPNNPVAVSPEPVTGSAA